MSSPTMPSIWPIMLPPLLSPQSIDDFTPDSFDSWVRGMRQESHLKAKQPKGPPRVSFRRNKRGTLIMTNRRRPLKYVTESEFVSACCEWGLSQQELWVYLVKHSTKVLKSHEDATEINIKLAEIPW